MHDMQAMTRKQQRITGRHLAHQSWGVTTYVRPPDTDDLSHIIQQPEESARQFWTRFLTKKNQIVDCPDAEALAAFKHNIRDVWLDRHLGQENEIHGSPHNTHDPLLCGRRQLASS